MSILRGKTYSSGDTTVTILDDDGEGWWKVLRADGSVLNLPSWRIGFQVQAVALPGTDKETPDA